MCIRDRLIWGMEKLLGRKPVMQILSMIAGLIVCYAFGSVWYMFFYARETGPIGLATVISWCVLPFIIPDLLKIALAFVVSRRLRKYVM